VTGACTNGTYFYFLGNDYYSDPVVQRYLATGSTSTLYMDYFPGLGTDYYDTAWLNGGIWIARDNADSPILAYDTDGLLVGHVEGTTLSAAMGLTVDTSGYLWASNPDDDKIYQLEVTTGIEEGSTPSPDQRIVSVSRNPFHSSVVLTSDGFSNAVIEIFDLTGRTVLNSAFSGSFVWDAVNVPPGSYFAVISDESGSVSRRLTRLN
jgi:hypothetical protein